ncbi:uncharacterized protein FIESC28_11411 [Fusarium coffeatum]|uniref:Transcription factor domain-containing protein n=1 Tax=Fusarium coffeatum TaxID=231269 RepID=A0A366QJS5_9HYPO|nr:uncharacterized protein FIESC28_11411 [Fusarium coffeatum]RBR05201.1 hypothetical protein FIESC28_11411 [Fusarium coffeatum]
MKVEEDKERVRSMVPYHEPYHVPDNYGITSLTLHTAPQPATSSPASHDDLEPDAPYSLEKVLHKCFDNPFTSDENRLPELLNPLFDRPRDGRINGHIKCNWPREEQANEPLGPAPVQSGGGTQHVQHRAPPSTGIESKFSGSTPSQTTMPNAPSSFQDVSAHAPPKLPPCFGRLDAWSKMDKWGKKAFIFYAESWCPGRVKGISYAVQSLSFIYIHDYLADQHLRKRANELYAMAVQELDKLLKGSKSNMWCQEVITMAIFLSMHDVILTEKRLEKDGKSQWLGGFKLCEYLLRQTDPGHRFWNQKRSHRFDRLRISQSIIVGRAVILAESMMELPLPMNPETECTRFDWLLYGTEGEMSEIHGGCGFSKLILHTWSQVTYCAARLQQEPWSPVVPSTAKFIFSKLTRIRQWNREGKSLKERQPRPETITWVRDASDGFVISSKEEMTEVTAEAWRIAAIIYYLCRLLRLPRDHEAVVHNMELLAKCIRIMPTSGSCFTAQAPLLPVFFLGLLSTTLEHRDVSQRWFERVSEESVRSSVRLLYKALKRIWKWIDVDPELQHNPTPVADDLGKRDAWWETLVKKVGEQEGQTLCLT